MPVDSDDPTLAESQAGPTDPVPRISDVGIDQRYDLGSILGRGGMGEVRNAKDTRVHRDVAVKLLRSGRADKDTVARFLREAQVQGRLEHPAIPPVHDLGVDRDNQPYFVMKKLAGTTLGEVLESRSSSDMLRKFPRRLLLKRLVDISLAIEFAHTRGVIHRDLKPANIMLGDFGEVYVLDWGLARVSSDEWSEIKALSGEFEPGHTAVGALLGTPGYMAPEQCRGQAVDARTDVYALGCILFEILTGVAALPKGLPAIDVTLTTPEHRPSKRVDVPPELDDLCARATAQEPSQRPTARELADGIQAYLDGDRDLETRKRLAADLVAHAKQLVESDRAEAMREASRALALDATNQTAQELVAHLVLEPPKEIPPEALAAADRERGVTRQRVLRWACVTYASVIGILCLLFLFPVRHSWPIFATMAVLAVMSVTFGLLSRSPLPMRSPSFILMLVLNSMAMIFASFIFGPMLIIPIFIVGSLAGWIMTPVAHSPIWPIGAHFVAFAAPVALELAGVTARTFEVVDGRLLLTPWAVDLTPLGALIILVGAVISQFANSSALGLSERKGAELALNRVHAQSWHLKQLVVTDKDK